MSLEHQNEGRDFEKRFAKEFGLKTVPGSGSGAFYKLDNEGKRMILSLKWTSAKSFRVSKDILDEAEEAVYGPGGVGGDYVPAVVTNVEDESFITFRASDLLRLFKEAPSLWTSEEASKKDVKKARAKVPSLFRNED
jgi:hypothetical protein